MKPDPKFFLAAACFSLVASFNANAATRHTEYRYPDQPNVVYSSDGQVYRTNESRPMAFSKFEAAISANDAQSIMQTSGYSVDVPKRVAPQPAAPAAPVWEPLPEPRTVARSQPAASDYVIQAGAFGSYKNAERLQQQLAPFGQARVSEGTKNGAPIYRVQLGGFSSKSAAQPTLDMIRANGFDGYVVSGT